MTTLTVIMAAGSGTRMGDLTADTPKAMLIDSHTKRPLIEESLTLKRYKTDIAVMSRKEYPFEKLNDYLDKKGIDILYQTVKPKSHALAFIYEYYKSITTYFLKESRKFLRTVNQYENIVLVPADHNLNADHLDLDDMLEKHGDSDISIVYSKEKSDCTSKVDMLLLDDNRIKRIQRFDGVGIPATSLGVYCFRRDMLRNLYNFFRGVNQWRKDHTVDFEVMDMKTQAYFIKGHGGGRDTPESIRGLP